LPRKACLDMSAEWRLARGRSTQGLGHAADVVGAGAAAEAEVADPEVAEDRTLGEPVSEGGHHLRTWTCPRPPAAKLRHTRSTGHKKMCCLRRGSIARRAIAAERIRGARETMDVEEGAPYVDLEELTRYIADRTGIPAEVVARVLQAESEYLVERGIAQEQQ
jgi:hypothetical protein